MANLIQNCVVIGTGASFNQALETLVSQTLGLDNLELCGTYLNRGIFVWTMVFVILCGILLRTEWLLLECGQDPVLAKDTEKFLLYYIPGLYFWGLCDLLRRYLNCFKKNFLPMMTFFVVAILHPFWVHYFVVELDMKLFGVAVAGFISNFMNFLMMMVLLLSSRDLQEARYFPDRRTFTDLWPYLSLGVPSVLMSFIDYWEWEQMTLASGFFGIEHQAIQVILIHLTSMSYMVARGMQSPCSTLVGN